MCSFYLYYLCLESCIVSQEYNGVNTPPDILLVTISNRVPYFKICIWRGFVARYDINIIAMKWQQPLSPPCSSAVNLWFMAKPTTPSKVASKGVGKLEEKIKEPKGSLVNHQYIFSISLQTIQNRSFILFMFFNVT